MGYGLVLIRRGFITSRKIYLYQQKIKVWSLSGVTALLPWTDEEFQCSCGVAKTQLCTQREDGGGVCSLLLSFGPEVQFIPVFQIMLSPDARNTAWVSFDGRKRQEICHGDRSSLFSDCIISKYRKS